VLTLVCNGNINNHPVQVTLNRLANASSFIYQTKTWTGGTIPTGNGTVAKNIVIETSGINYTVTSGDTMNYHPGNATIVVKDQSVRLLSALNQNFPNPLNPSTKIS
jgi:hypothetical protein